MIEVFRRDSSQQPGLYAFVIGISKYTYLSGEASSDVQESYGLRPLKSAAASAYRIYQWLLDWNKQSGQLASVRLLLSPSIEEEALFPQIKSLGTASNRINFEITAKHWRDDVSKNKSNIAFFYFAGHGLRSGVQDSILLLEDFGSEGGSSLKNSIEVKNLVDGMAPCLSRPDIAQKQFYFIDSCRDFPSKLERVSNPIIPAIWDIEISSLPDNRSRPIFFASVSGANAYGDQNTRQTVFSKILLDSFNGFYLDQSAGQKTISIQTLSRSLTKGFSEWNNRLRQEGINQEQIYSLGGESRDETIFELENSPNIQDFRPDKEIYPVISVHEYWNDLLAQTDAKNEFKLIFPVNLSVSNNPRKALLFYEGAEPRWEDIQYDNDVRRELESTIFESIHQNVNLPALLLISGPGGCGKSTLLRRIGWELSKQKNAVLFHHKDREVVSTQILADIYRLVRQPLFILVDDIFRKNYSELLNYLVDNNLPIFIIATSRNNELEATRANLARLTEPNEFSFGRLTKREIDDIFTKLSERGALSITDYDAILALKKIMESETEILTLMARLTKGSDFQAIIQMEIKNLRKVDALLLRAYQYVCLLYSIGIPTPIYLLKKLINSNEIYSDVINRDEIQGLIVPHSDRLVAARHELVAEYVANHTWVKPEQKVDGYKYILESIDISNIEERRVALALLKNLRRYGLRVLANQLIETVGLDYFDAYLKGADFDELVQGWAKLFGILGQDQKQEKCYELAVTQFPQNQDAFLEYAQFFDNVGKGDEADEYFRKAITLDIGATRAINLYASFLIREGRFEEANALLLNNISALEDKHLIMTFSNLLKEKGDLEGAEKYYILASEIDEQDSYVHTRYAQFLWGLGRTSEALIELQKALSTDSLDPSPLGLYVSYCRSLGQLPKAVSQVKLVLQKNPYSVSTWETLVYLLLENDDPTSALEQCQAALYIYPKNGSLQLTLITILKRLNRLEEALRQTLYYLSLNSGSTNDYVSLLNLAFQLNDIDVYSRAFDKFLQIWHTYAVEKFESSLVIPPSFSVEEEFLKKKIVESPHNIIARIIYAKHLLSQGQVENAKQILEIPNLTFQDEQLRIQFQVYILQSTNNLDEAQRFLKDFLEKVDTLWARLTLVNILRIKSDESYKKELLSIIVKYPTYIDGRLANVNLLIEENRLNEAKSEMQELLLLQPDNSGYRFKYVQLLIEENPKEAENQLQKILINLSPLDVGARRLLIKLLINRGEKQAIIDQHVNFLNTILPESQAVTFVSDRGVMLRKVNRKVFSSTEELFAALDSNPIDSNLLLQGVRILEKKMRKEDAIALFERAITYSSIPSIFLRQIYAEFLERMSDIDLAVKQLDMAIKEHPNKKDGYIAKALFLDRQGQNAEAEKVLYDAQQLPGIQFDAKKFTLLGNVMFESEHLTVADNYFRLALILDPQDHVTHLNYALFLNHRGKYDSADMHFKECIKVRPDYIAAHQAYAIFLGNSQNKNEAIEQFENALAIAPENVSVLSGYANFLTKKRSTKNWARKAEELFKRALSIDPNHHQSLLSYASLLRREHRTQEIQGRLAELLTNNDKDYRMRQVYATILKDNGQLEEARAQLLLAFDPHPRTPKMRFHNATVHTALAKLLQDLEWPSEDIIEHYEQAIAIPSSLFQGKFHLILVRNDYGKYLCKLGNFDQAKEQFEAALRLDENNSYVLNAYARCLEANNDLENALHQYQEVLKNGLQEHAILGSANILVKLKRFAEAELQYKKGLHEFPNNTYIRQAYIRSLDEQAWKEQRRNNIQEVCRLLTNLKEIRPHDITIARRLVEAFEKLQDYAQARQLYSEITQYKVADAEDWFFWAQMEHELKQYDTARNLFDQAIAKDPKSSKYHYRLALLEWDTGNYPKAQHEFQLATNLVKSNGFYWYNWALMERDLGNYDEARTYFRNATQTVDCGAQQWHDWAQMEIDLGNYTKGDELLNKAIRASNAKAIHWVTLAKLKYSLKQTASAIELLTEANLYYPDISLIWEELARIELADNNPQKALEHINQAVSLSQNDFHHYILRGQIYNVLMQNQKAEEDFLKANILLDTEVKVTGEDAYLLRMKGKLLGLRRNFDEAEIALERSIELANKYAKVQAYIELGEVYVLQKKFNAAALQWRRALDHAPDDLNAKNKLDSLNMDDSENH